jgi:Holliday junction resolvase
MLEKSVKEKIKKILKQYGAWYCMPIGTRFGKSGVPDFICCYKGHFLAVEAKSSAGKPTALQSYEMAKIDQNDGTTMVINDKNIEGLEEWLKTK